MESTLTPSREVITHNLANTTSCLQIGGKEEYRHGYNSKTYRESSEVMLLEMNLTKLCVK